jgi:hypothetical protein
LETTVFTRTHRYRQGYRINKIAGREAFQTHHLEGLKMNYKNINWKHIVIIVFILVFTMCIGYLIYFNIRQGELLQRKKVLFLDWDTGQKYAFLMSTNLDGAFLQRVGLGTGALSWSRDGKYVALGCEDPTRICILDPANFYDSTLYPPIIPKEPSEIKRVSIPKECIAVSSWKGISSISWAKNDQQLIIVCQNNEKSNVCIINIDDGSNQCWGEKGNTDLISRADWSPVSDSIVIDTGKKIQTVTKQGKIIDSVMDGWSPAWSPDGKEIAFIHWDDERGYAGIAVVRVDGSNFRWAYRPPKQNSDKDADYYKLSFNDASKCMGASKIAWGPDEKYLIVEANYMDLCNFSIFKVEIGTGKVSNITTNLSNSYQEPVVQP